MNKLFLTSDTHFNHWKLGRSKGSTESYIKTHNEIVRETDTVIHLGDVIFSKASELTEINSRLNGSKILVRGNHDKRTNAWYRNHGFVGCFNRLEIGKFVFTHKPLFWVMWGKINYHGHLHTPSKSHRTGGGGSRHRLILEMEIRELMC